MSFNVNSVFDVVIPTGHQQRTIKFPFIYFPFIYQMEMNRMKEGGRDRQFSFGEESTGRETFKRFSG